MKPFLLLLSFFFSIPEVWACSIFGSDDCKHSGSTASVFCHFPLGVTFPIGAIVNFFLLAVVLASLLVISKGAVYSSSSIITDRPVATVEVTCNWWRKQISGMSLQFWMSAITYYFLVLLRGNSWNMYCFWFSINIREEMREEAWIWTSTMITAVDSDIASSPGVTNAGGK